MPATIVSTAVTGADSGSRFLFLVVLYEIKTVDITQQAFKRRRTISDTWWQQHTPVLFRKSLRKIYTILIQSRRHRGALVGLAPSNKAPSPPN